MNNRITAKSIGSKTTSKHLATHKKGYVYGVTYNEMFELLGEQESECSSDGKVDARWDFETKDNSYFSVWNYKNGPAYRGLTPDQVEYKDILYSISDWSVWYKDEKGKEALRQIFGENFVDSPVEI